MGGLPQHESGQPLLAAGTDHQVGVGLVTRIEMLADEVDVHRLGDVLDRGALVGGVEEHGAHGVGDLLAAAVADGDVDQYPVDVRRGLLGLLQRGLHLGGQDVRRAHVVHPPAAVGGEGAYDALDDAEQGDELVLGAVEVVRRQQPEGDDLDVGLRAPAEELLDLVGTGTVPLGGRAARRLRPAPVAVHDDADVLGHLVVVEVALHPARVEPEQQPAQVVPQVHVLSAPPCGSDGRGRAASLSATPVHMTVPGGEAYPRETNGPARACPVDHGGGKRRRRVDTGERGGGAASPRPVAGVRGAHGGAGRGGGGVGRGGTKTGRSVETDRPEGVSTITLRK